MIMALALHRIAGRDVIKVLQFVTNIGQLGRIDVEMTSRNIYGAMVFEIQGRLVRNTGSRPSVLPHRTVHCALLGNPHFNECKKLGPILIECWAHPLLYPRLSRAGR